MYFKEESKQVSVEQGKREYVFILTSLWDGNTNTPNYDIVDDIPEFKKSGWQLLNPTSYLLQDLNVMRKVVVDVFKGLLADHVRDEHGFSGDSTDIESSLVKKDYSNLHTPWTNGKYSLVMSSGNETTSGLECRKTKSSNGIMEYAIRYGFDMMANQDVTDSENARIKDKRYFYQKSPIHDESDDTIFSKKYLEEDMFSVALESG